MGSTVAAFFTTTLPAAFTATIAFLGPQGLIAVALLALAAIWYKWGDQIKDIVSKVYTAVKTWLVDKLAAIWDTVKQKIEAVKGYFKDLYTAVVGQSYIPDMVEGIGRSIAQLDNVFVKPSQLANQLVGAAFQEMTKVATRALTDLLQKVTGHFTDITDTVIPSFASRGIGRMSEAGTGFKDAFLGSFGAGLAQGLVQLAGAGLGALVNHFQGGEEAKVVNPIRDAFFAMFGGYEGLAAQLTAASDGNIADQLLKTLFNADTKVAFDAAKEAIEAVLAGAGQAVQDSPAQAAMESLGVSVEGLATQLTALHEQITTWQAAFTASITALASSVTDVLQAAWVGFVTQFQESVALMAALIMDPLTLQWTTWVQTFTDTSYAVIGLIQDALIPQVQAFIGALDAIPRSIDVSINVSRSEMPDMSVDAVPSFANEGIVSKPMFAVVGDAPEPEWILHESSVQALVNRGAAMGAALWQSASGGTSTSDLAGGGRSGGDSFSLQLSPGAIVVHQQPGEDPVAFARRLVTAIPDALRYDHSLVRKIRGATA
jgi:hypothetical protein